jgi:hypothetical protein
MPVVDPDLRTKGTLYGYTQKDEISVMNNTKRVLHVMVLDDINATRLMQCSGEFGAGTTGVKMGASAKWESIRQASQYQTISPGKKSVFEVQGQCGHLWVSDVRDFPDSRTLYKQTRIPKGYLKRIDENKFEELRL